MVSIALFMVGRRLFYFSHLGSFNDFLGFDTGRISSLWC